MKLSFSLLLTTIALFAQGQFLSKLQYGVDAGGNYTEIDLTERVELQMSLTATMGRSQVFLGPVLQMYASEAQTDAHKPKLTGIRGGYLYMLPTQATRFHLLFRYEFTLQQYENKWIGNFYDEASQDYISYNQESEEFFSAHTVGYGFSYNISEHLRIRTVIAVGVYFSNIREERKYNYAPTNIIYDFRGYDDFGFCWKPSLSLGYTF